MISGPSRTLRLLLDLGERVAIARRPTPVLARGQFSAPGPVQLRHQSTAASGAPAHSKRLRDPSHRRVLYAATLAVSLSSWAYLSHQSLSLEEERNDHSPPRAQAIGRGLIPYAEVQKHDSAQDCWVVINGKVYDLTEFAGSGHPGGPSPIHRAAGRDASALFNPIHPPGTIENGVDPSALVGLVDPATLPRMTAAPSPAEEGTEREIDLAEIIGLPDFEEAARRKLSKKAWAYMSSGATDQISLGLNKSAFDSILFRPRILADVSHASTATTMLGHTASLPVFICPCGMAGLAHPLGEKAWASGAAQCDAIQMISTNASTPLSDIAAAGKEGQTFFLQLYVDRNRAKSETLLRKAEELGIKGIFVTVDAAAPGKREADERSRAEVEVASGISGGKIAADTKGGGIGRSVGGFIDPSLNWDDLAWLRRHTKLPIGLKGIQCIEDVVRAKEAGVNAIYLSNHGGRALDGAQPAMYTLMEIRKHCPEVFDSCEVYLDGGVRRGTDVVKALCLGATGVGVGRPMLYGLTYGEAGVVHALEIMRDEIEITLKLLGVNSISELGPHLLNTRKLDPLICPEPSFGPRDMHGH